MVTPHPVGSGPQDSVADAVPPAEERHRALLAVLGDEDGESLALDDIAAAVAGQLDPPAGSDSVRGDHRQLRIALHHIHLPKLGALAGLEYDPGSSRLEAAEDSIAEALSEAPVQPTAWSDGN